MGQCREWANFAKEHTDEIDWKGLECEVTDHHMKDFYGCLNAICVEELHFAAYIFHGVVFNPSLKQKVLRDIQINERAAEQHNSLFARIFYKMKMWKGNRWKRKLLQR